MCIYDIESMLHMYVVHKSLCHTYIPHIVFYIYFDLPYVWHAYVWHRIHIVCTCMLEFYTYMYVCKKFQDAYINVSMKVYMLHTCTCMWMLSTNLVRNGSYICAFSRFSVSLKNNQIFKSYTPQKQN